MTRRSFLRTASVAALAGATTPLRTLGAQLPASARPVRPRRLSRGDTVALVGPASATFLRMDLEIARESLEALGLNVLIGPHLQDRHGYLAGSDPDRAADINQLFADTAVRAVLPIRGGWGSSRLLPYLDYDAIRRNPKIIVGYSDITALLLAIYTRANLVTFHGPNGMGSWDGFSVEYFRRVLFDAEAVTFVNAASKKDTLAQTEYRVQTITPGVARGRLLGGNLSVLAALLGSSYLPSFDGAILFLEDIKEDIYRVDRMMTSLKLAGVLEKIRGFVFGTCEECEPGEGYGSLTIEEVFDDHVNPLGVPAWRGAMIGHRMPQFTLPVGGEVEIDATKGTIRMVEPAVT